MGSKRYLSNKKYLGDHVLSILPIISKFISMPFTSSIILHLMKKSIHDDITQLLKEVTLNLEINECQFKIDDDPLIPYEQWDNCIK